MEVTYGLLVFLEAKVPIAFLERVVAHVLQLGCDFEDLYTFPFFFAGLLVFGPVFIWVAGGVRNLLGGFVIVVAAQLAAVIDCGIVPWLVTALGLKVLDLSDDALAVDHFAEDDVLIVEMWCGDGCNEEL